MKAGQDLVMMIHDHDNPDDHNVEHDDHDGGDGGGGNYDDNEEGKKVLLILMMMMMMTYTVCRRLYPASTWAYQVSVIWPFLLYLISHCNDDDMDFLVSWIFPACFFR